MRRCLGAAFALFEMQAPAHTRRRAIAFAPDRGAEVVLT